MGARRTLTVVALALAFALALVLAGSGWQLVREGVDGVIEKDTGAPFYSVPTSVPAATPGTLYRSAPIPSAPAGTRAWRVLYHSTDVLGHDILVSGVVIAPTAPAPMPRTVVSWGHPTTGAAARCAPSLGFAPFSTIEGVNDLLRRGYVVAATDYPGMGLESPDSYLIGASEGNSVLDIARVAKKLTGASDRLLLWGHSQGGHAALFAAQSASTYAPEFDLLGVGVAAPATDLAQLLNDDITGLAGVTIASYAFDAYAKVYGPSTPGAELDSILTPAGAAATPSMAALCLLGQNSQIHAIAKPLVGGYLANDPATTEPWSALLQANTPGAAPVAVPVFVAQGAADTLVVPTATDAFVAHECSIGTAVSYFTYPDTTHATIAYRALPRLLDWFAGLERGKNTLPHC